MAADVCHVAGVVDESWSRSVVTHPDREHTVLASRRASVFLSAPGQGDDEQWVGRLSGVH